MVPYYHCVSIMARISFIILYSLVFHEPQRTNYRTGQSSSCDLKICSRIFYYWYYISSLVSFFFFVSSLLHLVLRPSPRRGAPKRDDRQRSAAQMPRARRRSTGWSCARKERKRERERPTWPAPKSRRDTNVREYKWIPTSEERRRGRVLPSSPLALDEISLHPVRDIFHGRRLQLLSQRFSAILLDEQNLDDVLFDSPPSPPPLIFSTLEMR